jgi:hypothetical protein
MMKRSPFAVATAAAVAAPTPNFAKDLYIANAARTPEGDLITLASTTDKNFKKYPTSTTPDDGYSILNVDWSNRVGETKVTIGKGGQTATLTFNQALISQMPSNPAPVFQPPPQQVQQGAGVPPVPQYNNPSIVKPGLVPTLPTPPPRVRGVIPRSPNGAVPQAQPEQKEESLVKDE